MTTEPSTKTEEDPFIPYVDPADYPQSMATLLERYADRMGFLPNAVRLYLHRPEIASTLFTLNNNVMRDESSVLDQGLKRRLAALASKTNGCKYCTTHNCHILKSPGGFGAEGWDLGPEQLTALLTGDDTPANDFERVCFDFVRSASEDPTQVPGEIYGRLTKLLTPPQIVELACLVGFWKFYNTVHDSLRIPIESALRAEALNVDAG
jgi:alkylhydroperoxidase family enzyme